MKILAVCAKGFNRSLHTKYLMQWRRKADGGGFNDVIPIGVENTSRETLAMLFDWADWIILTDSSLKENIPLNYHDNKLKVWDVGEDRWPRPFNKELLDLFRSHMEREFSK